MTGKVEGVDAKFLRDYQTLNYKVRDGETLKVPYLAVIGGREAEAGTVAVRTRGAGSKQDIIPQAEFVARLQSRIRTRSLEL